VAEAIGKLAPRLTSCDARPLRQAEAALWNFLDIRKPENPEWASYSNTVNEAEKSGLEWKKIYSHLDVLGEKTQSWKTISNLWTSADSASRRWGVISNLKTQDFYDALKAGLNLQEIRNSNDTI